MYTSGSTGTPKGVVISHRERLTPVAISIPAIRLARMTGCWPSPPYILIYRFTTFLAYCARAARW
ncbi:AMP-binding protein [Escherichia coli]|nr:AMP-binding protein [Escherichia coli]